MCIRDRLGTSIAATGPFEGLVAHLRAQANTTITILTTVTAFTGTYNVEGSIIQIS